MRLTLSCVGAATFAAMVSMWFGFLLSQIRLSVTGWLEAQDALSQLPGISELAYVGAPGGPTRYTVIYACLMAVSWAGLFFQLGKAVGARPGDAREQAVRMLWSWLFRSCQLNILLFLFICFALLLPVLHWLQPLRLYQGQDAAVGIVGWVVAGTCFFVIAAVIAAGAARSRRSTMGDHCAPASGGQARSERSAN